LFTVKLILEKFWEYIIDVHQIFVDFKQAYDKINREKLYKIMLYFFLIPEKLIRLTKVTTENSAFHVKTDRTNNVCSPWFQTTHMSI
jgi:hypothetical protein